MESKLGDAPSSSLYWRAVHVEQRKRLAVKIFSLPFGGTPEAKKELANEWETLKRLRHNAIARCYGGGFEKNDAYLAFELVDGESLEAQVERSGRLPWEAVIDLADPLADALAYAHARQVIHGGLVPDKIRLAGLAPVIVDYRIDRGRSLFRNQRPPSAFELAFQAPEVISDGRDVSVKSDLYSFGAILFYALVGRPPIPCSTPEEVVMEAAHTVPPKVAREVLDCPIWLSALVDQLLQKDPASRPHGAPAVQLALREVRKRSAAGTGVAEHSSAGFSPLKLDTDKEEARKLLGRVEAKPKPEADGQAFYEKAWFLVLALVVLGSLIGWALWPPSEDYLRRKAEVILAQEEQSRASLSEVKNLYLHPMLRRFPEGEHADWAREQLDLIEMGEAERGLEGRLKSGLPLRNEAEKLYAEANQFKQFGDAATALQKYKSMVTLLEGNEEHRPFVNLARREIRRIETEGIGTGEASRIVRAKLNEADQLMLQNKPFEAKRIWDSIIELYRGNAEMEPLVKLAQNRLEDASQDPPNER
ncbi:MAG: serine/threonine-protein kinase [Pirellulaceae bacterium]